jgi:hypothetical protein
MLELIQKQPGAYILSHNGLGDNITMIGAIRFLSNYYETIYFLCKDKYESNVKLFFADLKVVTVSFDSRDERNSCTNIINNAKQQHEDIDVFICGGCHTCYLTSKVTHPSLLSYKKNDKSYTSKFDHIQKFYYDAGLDLSIYFEFFDISSSNESKALYKELESYKVAFFHTQASNEEVDLSEIYNRYKNEKDYIVICANKNVYDVSNPEQKEKHAIAEKYINIPIAHYIDIIKNANSIHVVDSCFSCIVYPLMVTNKLKASEVVIHERKYE